MQGTWSSRLSLIDYNKCPGVSSTPSTQTPRDCIAIVGAESCTRCPPNLPHTKEEGSIGPDACTLCPKEHHWVGGGCRKCRAPCDSSSSFETRGCLDAHDRVCTACDSSGCAVGEYASECPGPRKENPARVSFRPGLGALSWATDS